MSPDERLAYLLGRHFDDALTVEESQELNQQLESPAARAVFWREARINARLRQWGEQRTGQSLDARGASAGAKGYSRWTLAGVAASVIAIAGVLLAGVGGRWLGAPEEPTIVARFVSVEDARWVAAAEQHHAGEAIASGQRLELSSGETEIEFLSGACLRVLGPAIFRVDSENACFLTLGQVLATADTPRSHGFTVRTRTAKAIDQGAEFMTRAGLDGQSLVEVTSGAVDVEVPGRKQHQRIISGNSLRVEPGLAPVLVHIERGDETAAFRFATIAPPSDQDDADSRQGRSRFSISRGTLTPHPQFGSGPVDVLFDGRGQTRPDAPRESLFFANGAEGRLLLDLGAQVSVARVNTYSWHQNGAVPENRVRAVQKFTLYGFAGETPPASDGPEIAPGWVRIARVDSDAFFEVADPIERPAQQGCSITAATGSLGAYRYLMFDVQPTANVSPNHPPNHTFYGEIDVYADPTF